MAEPKAYEPVSHRGNLSFTQRPIVAITALVLIPRNEVWWITFSEFRGRLSVCTNIERNGLAEYRGATDGLNKVAPEVAPTI